MDHGCREVMASRPRRAIKQVKQRNDDVRRTYVLRQFESV
jgi:hypothetical protein